ncbi:MAG: cytochrome P460 family protein [Deltaproteobacteria bacterium]|nr:cytochrome P460 family protein [Deltaproteobacteria bacterium]
MSWSDRWGGAAYGLGFGDRLRDSRRWLLQLMCAVLSVLVLGGESIAVSCIGDCNGDREVTVDELLLGVNIALETASSAACPSFDANNDGSVTVDELLSAVGNALNGCPATPVPSSSPTPSTTPVAPTPSSTLRPTSSPTSSSTSTALPPTATPTPTTAVTPIFAASYRSTYTLVRDCRFSSEHGLVYIRVLVNSIGAQAYLNNANPLPVGTTVVKEEYASADCSDSSLLRWRVMRKEAPGFDPVDGDWHWQWVESNRSVTLNDKSTCIGCHTVPACLSRDHMCTLGSAPRGTLQTVLTRQPAALLSIAGTSANDVYAVGSDPGDGFGPYVLHYNGAYWQRLNTGKTGDLWWISVVPIDGAFYMAGVDRTVLRYEPQTNRFIDLLPPSGSEVLFGIWGTSATDIWAVGGNPTDESGGGLVLHFDGITWSPVDLSSLLPGGIPTLYKVWGRGVGDVYAVGRNGMILHYDGSVWSVIPSNTTQPLFTVHGNESLVAASGGFSGGVILEREGDQFVDRAPLGSPQMNGVFVPTDGQAVAVGIVGSLALRSDAGWKLADTGLSTQLDFHATWVDSDGGIWAVGGDLSGLSSGMLAYGGAQTIGSQVKAIVLCPPPSPNPGATVTVSYSRDIVPLFNSATCTSISCHGGPFASNSYDMRSYATTFGPGLFAKSLKLCEIVAGDPDNSFLIEKLQPSPRIGVRMPNMLAPLSDQQIGLVRTWIMEGAYDDSPATPTSQTSSPTPTSATMLTPRPTATVVPTSGATFTPDTACAQVGVICTVAGTGEQIFNGDGKPALETALYYPLGVHFDGQGRALIIDWNNLRIRRINNDGTIQTVMGEDYEGTPVDGALANQTPLHHASDIAFDPDGQLYVAGDHVPVVFRVGLDDRVFLAAGTTATGYSGDGGPALRANLNTPFGVLPDTKGGFYIADITANVIRYVNATGIINTVAGTGAGGYSGDGGPATAAQLSAPARMRLDGAGNLYFVETKNHVVRRLALDGTISTFAGSGRRGYDGDGGRATQALFNAPYDLAFAPNGDLYVADTGNSVIRRIDGSGIVSTVVGIGFTGFGGDRGNANTCTLNQPAGISFAGDGSLWISDTFNNRVRRVFAFLDRFE